MTNEKEVIPRVPLTVESVVSMVKRDLSDVEIGKLHGGQTRQAVHQFKRRHGLDKEGMEAVEQFKKDKPFLLHAKQKMVLDSITPKVIEKMSGRDRFIAVGICEDKIASIERGGPNVINNWLQVVQLSQQRPGKAIDVTPAGEVTNE